VPYHNSSCWSRTQPACDRLRSRTVLSHRFVPVVCHTRGQPDYWLGVSQHVKRCYAVSENWHVADPSREQFWSGKCSSLGLFCSLSGLLECSGATGAHSLTIDCRWGRLSARMLPIFRQILTLCLPAFWGRGLGKTSP